TKPCEQDDVTYDSNDTPPSFTPAKTYLLHTNIWETLRHADAEEYRRLRMLPGDITNGCLHLRKANTLGIR
ncbi:unnamed protein product, partial [Candidula unifasciata]